MSEYRYFKQDIQNHKPWDIQLITCGKQNNKAGEEYPEKTPYHPQSHYFEWEKGRRLKGYYFVYVPIGSGSFEAENCGEKAIGAGDGFLLFPDVWHRYRPNEKTGWQEYWFGFTGTYPEYLVRNNFLKKDNPIIKVGYNDHIISLFEELITVSKKEFIGLQNVMSGIALQILAFACAAEQNPFFNKKYKINAINGAIDLIHSNYKKEINFKDYCSQMALSYTHFRRLFKQETGFSPQQFLLNYRIENAKTLLRNTMMLISEIGYSIGFNSLHYFSKLFRQKTGYNPTDFRQKHSIED